MPPSPTDVIEDDDASSPTISELDSDRFTYSGDDDASSDSTPNVTTPESPRKRHRLATSRWQLAHGPLPHEAIRGGKNRIGYCLMWAYGDKCGKEGFGGLGRI